MLKSNWSSPNKFSMMNFQWHVVTRRGPSLENTGKEVNVLEQCAHWWQLLLLCSTCHHRRHLSLCPLGSGFSLTFPAMPHFLTQLMKRKTAINTSRMLNSCKWMCTIINNKQADYWMTWWRCCLGDNAMTMIQQSLSNPFLLASMLGPKSSVGAPR